MYRLSCPALFLLLISSAVVYGQASQPQLSNPTLAKVGDVNITKAMMDKRFAQLPPNLPQEKRREIQARFLQEMIFENLVKEYLRANNVPFTEKDLAEVQRRQEQVAQRNPTAPPSKMNKEDRENLARSVHLQEETISPDKVDALIKDHPEYFDGTKVCASHILILCNPLASTKKQKDAVTRLKRIKTDVRAGQISFADAARAYSDCPSKEKGGDLGEFSFTDMVPPFAQAAFDAKAGDVTDIVRTEFGFHLIHVNARSKGTGKPSQQASAVARNLLLAELQNRIFDQALTTVPVVKYKSQTETQPGAASEPAK